METQTYTFQGHTFTITAETDGTFSTCIDNSIFNGGWAYRRSAFDHAQRRIIEINNKRS